DARVDALLELAVLRLQVDKIQDPSLLLRFEQFAGRSPHALDFERHQAIADLAAAAPIQAARPAGVFVARDHAMPAPPRRAPGSPQIGARRTENRDRRSANRS